MEKLKVQYRKAGYIYTQIKRTEQTAIYAISALVRGKRGNRPKEVQIGYEVFKVVIRNKREVYPSVKSWGKTAFSVKTKKQADASFEKLNKKEIGDKNG